MKGERPPGLSKSCWLCSCKRTCWDRGPLGKSPSGSNRDGNSQNRKEKKKKRKRSSVAATGKAERGNQGQPHIRKRKRAWNRRRKEEQLKVTVVLREKG